MESLEFLGTQELPAFSKYFEGGKRDKGDIMMQRAMGAKETKGANGTKGMKGAKGMKGTKDTKRTKGTKKPSGI